MNASKTYLVQAEKTAKIKQLKEYLFAKMGPGDRGPKTTEDREAPKEKTGWRKFLEDNVMLLAIVVGVLTGIGLGLSLRTLHLSPEILMLLSYPGELFMRILKLMILPLIIASLIASSASLNAKMSGKIAVRTLVYFVLTSMFNAFLGIVLATLLKPGAITLAADMVPEAEIKGERSVIHSIMDIGRNIFPDNIVEATFQQAYTEYVPSPAKNGSDPVMIAVVSSRSGTNTIGLVFFCLVFGSILGSIGPKGQVVVDFFQAIFEVIMKMVSGVMWCTPVGVTSVVAGKILALDDVGQVLSQLGWFIATVAIGVFFYQLVVMQLIYFVFLRKNPYKFYFGLSQAMMTAAATASTAAALPTTFKAMEGPLRIDPRITRFVLPIGCNINMDGTALFLAVASVFICQMNHMCLGLVQLATIFLACTAASVSSASVPSAALVLLLVVLSAVDAPPQDISLLFAVDWLVDRIRTTNNMLGDCYAAAVVEHLSKNELMACDVASMESTTAPTPLEDPATVGKQSITSDQVTIDLHLSSI
ncbi:hypothetical protein O0L34_g11639 [Tuta absoluta]|nr:hypothetical protein O0L34_g11639 [Tuta absoluta]